MQVLHRPVELAGFEETVADGDQCAFGSAARLEGMTFDLQAS